MVSVNKVLGKFTKMIKSLEQVSEVNLDTAHRKTELVAELEQETTDCLAEAARADKIVKKLEELFEL